MAQNDKLKTILEKQDAADRAHVAELARQAAAESLARASRNRVVNEWWHLCRVLKQTIATANDAMTGGRKLYSQLSIIHTERTIADLIVMFEDKYSEYVERKCVCGRRSEGTVSVSMNASMPAAQGISSEHLDRDALGTNRSDRVRLHGIETSSDRAASNRKFAAKLNSWRLDLVPNFVFPRKRTGLMVPFVVDTGRYTGSVLPSADEWRHWFSQPSPSSGASDRGLRVCVSWKWILVQTRLLRLSSQWIDEAGLSQGASDDWSQIIACYAVVGAARFTYIRRGPATGRMSSLRATAGSTLSAGPCWPNDAKSRFRVQGALGDGNHLQPRSARWRLISVSAR